MLDLYVIKEGKRLRCGYTTGSCATAAAKAAAIMLETGSVIHFVEIDTPANVRLKLEVCNPKIDKDKASCSIIKDAGDDPDNTDGMEIYAEVRKREDGIVRIDGGIGIGRIIRKGLFGEIHKEIVLNEEDIFKIKDRMKKLIESDLEKTRESYQYKNTLVEIDINDESFCPFPYIEIETENEKELEEVVSLLGYTLDDTTSATIYEILQKEGAVKGL